MNHENLVPGDLAVSDVVMAGFKNGEEDWAPVFSDQKHRQETTIVHPDKIGRLWTFADVALVLAWGFTSDRRWWAHNEPHDSGPVWYLVVTSRGCVGYVHYSQLVRPENGPTKKRKKNRKHP